MAVAISQTANPAGAGSGTTITYSTQSTGVADENRYIALVVGAELTSGSPSSVTIDGVAMTAGTLGSLGAVFSRIFYKYWPLGTTADFAITFGASQGATTHHIAVYRVVGGVFSAESAVGDTDADPISSGAITIPTNGGCIGICAMAGDATVRTWTGITEDIDADAGTFQFTTGMSTTAGTPTITVSGGNNEDGALSWLIFKPGYTIAATTTSFAITGTDAGLKHNYKFVPEAGAFAFSIADVITADYGIVAESDSFVLTGTDVTLTEGGGSTYTLAADGDSFALTGTDAGLKYNWMVVADSGSFAITGTDLALQHSKEIDGEPGTFAITGTDADLRYGWMIAGEAGSFGLSGSDASLIYGYPIIGEYGTFDIAGTDADLAYGFKLAADGDAFVINGTDVSFNHFSVAGLIHLRYRKV